MSSALDQRVLQRSRRRLGGYVRRASLAMLLLELPGGQALEISDPMAELLGRTRDEALATSAPEFTEDPEATRTSLAMLASGSLDGYTRRVTLPRPSGGPVTIDVRVDACDTGGPDRLAVVTVLPTSSSSCLGGPPDSGRDLIAPVMGTMTADGVVDRIVSDHAGLLPEPAHGLLGRSLLEVIHAEDAGVVMLLAAHCGTRAATVTGRARLRSRQGGWQQGRIALQSLSQEVASAGEPAGFAFALSLVRQETEQRDSTWVVDPSSGFAVVPGGTASLHTATVASWIDRLPTVQQRPALATLTDREREIVARLVGAQRVAVIARELFLSQSTVRNHLTAVYRKFGVRSQIELLELLRPR
ncbi:MAG: Response regulator containing a CheY-like receiver domain and an DNA-binding domain [Frankiales bacterium]|nr:Response regulator containing a CheY-like receiver domain and an DNA-binding domain [Frankiales bacterium]